jgi:outer membrane protein TolC
MQQNSMEQLAIDIGKEVDEKYKGMTKSRRNVLLAEKQLSLAEENHHLVSRQYEAGIVTSLDVLNATTELGTKRINQVLEQLWFDLAIVALIESIGEYYPLAVVPRDTP